MLNRVVSTSVHSRVSSAIAADEDASNSARGESHLGLWDTLTTFDHFLSGTQVVGRDDVWLEGKGLFIQRWDTLYNK